MDVLYYDVANIEENEIIPLGISQETNVRQIVFGCGSLIEAYGDGNVQIINRRPKELVGYCCENVVKDGDDVTWTVNSDDTAFSGHGHVQLRWYVNGALKESFMIQTYIRPSITSITDLPEEVKSALDLIMKYVEENTIDIDDLDERIANYFDDHPLPVDGLDTELKDIRVGADGITYPSAGDAVRGQMSDIKHGLDANALSCDQVLYNVSTQYIAGSSNWPDRQFSGRTSLWNGTFGTVATDFYQDLLHYSYYATTKSGIERQFYNFTALQAGHIYSIKSYVLSGSITVESGKVANVVVKDILTIPIGGSGTFEFNGNVPKFYLHFSSGVTLSNAVIAVIVEDITNTFDIKESIFNGATKKKLSGYSWVQGKHVTRGASISSPYTATNTIALTNSIPYDYNMYFILKSGWMVNFASAENDIVTGTATEYISTPGRINMIDVYNNLGYNTVHYFGNSLIINIRKSDASDFTLADINIDDVLEMYVVNKNGDVDGSKTWVAIGDSITDGRYSQSDGTVRSKTNHYCQYGYIASRILGIDSYIEQGYGGMGYIHVANDGTYLTDVLEMDFGNPDVISVNLGVNDRSQPLGSENSTANDGTISGAVRNCCEVLGAKYPYASIIFMTPINAYATGSESTGWCKRSGTTHLEDISNIIKYWAGLYGFPVIDMLNECPVNDFNIKTMILDELHPTMEAHCMIGKFLAGKIPYKVI